MRATHHHATMEVVADGDRTRLVWMADVLPHHLVDRIAPLMAQGAAAMQATLKA